MDCTSFNKRNLDFMCIGAPKTSQELRSFRSTAAVTLRKERRHHFLMHKRLNKVNDSPGVSVSLDSALQDLSLSNISSVKTLRKLLCSESLDLITLMQLRPNIIHELSKGLQMAKPELAYEVAWCMANLALGPPMLVNDINLYRSIFIEVVIIGENKALAEQSCWVLGNLAAENRAIREQIRNTPGLLKGMVHLLMLKSCSLNAVACWAMTNLIRGYVPDSKHFFEAGALSPVLEITHKPYSSQVVESLWLLSFFTYSAPDEVYELIYAQANITDYLKYLDYEDAKIIIPIIRILGNGFLMYPYFDYLFSTSEFSERLIKMVTNDHTQIKKESLWMLSNLITLCYIDNLMRFYGGKLISVLCALVTDETEEIKTEAGIALYNLSEVYSSLYLPRILQCSSSSIFKFFVSNIQNVPVWVKFQIQVICDIDLLKVSLGFIALCLELNECPREAEELILCDDVREAVEDCKFTLEKGQSRYSSSEAYIIQMCEHILKWFPLPEFGFS